MEIGEYIAVDGSCPFEEWFNDLNAEAAAKVTTAITRMRQGNFSNVISVGGGVQERKIDFGPGYRVYLGRDGDRLIILLGGGTKKGQDNDIADAIELWKEYKHRKKGETEKWHSQKTLKKLFRLV